MFLHFLFYSFTQLSAFVFIVVVFHPSSTVKQPKEEKKNRTTKTKINNNNNHTCRTAERLKRNGNERKKVYHEHKMNTQKKKVF